jgi:hypothetical protein
VRTWYCKWFQEFVNSGFIDPKLVFFLDERKFIFDVEVKRQNNKRWCSKNRYLVHEIPLYDLQGGVSIRNCRDK